MLLSVTASWFSTAIFPGPLGVVVVGVVVVGGAVVVVVVVVGGAVVVVVVVVGGAVVVVVVVVSVVPDVQAASNEAAIRSATVNKYRMCFFFISLISLSHYIFTQIGDKVKGVL